MRKLRTMHLFAGAGGGLLADVLLGHQPVCAVEIDEYCQQVLSARQEDGCFPWFPIFEDVQAFDGRPWRGIVDVVAGGFPCQDISVAGSGAGLDGERSGLWREMARIIGEVRPRYAFIENSPALVTRGLGRVLADLASMGFDARWGIVSAADTGAHHIRERLWILAHADSNAGGERPEFSMQRGWAQKAEQAGVGGCRGSSEDVADPNSVRELQQTGGECDKWDGAGYGSENLADAVRQCKQGFIPCGSNQERREKPERRPAGSCCYEFAQWPVEPGMDRVVNGMANRSHRIKAVGNGQVPRVHAAAFRLLFGS